VIGAVGTLHLVDLSPSVQQRMLDEWQLEQESGNPYVSERLSAAGVQAFAAAMPEAILHGTELTLARAVARRDYWKGGQLQRRRGRWVMAATPRNAHEVLATTEYLTWYTRAIAGILLEEGEVDCVVYRAAPARQPRCLCSHLEGRAVKTADVYAGHRAQYWPNVQPTAFSIPVGPNCHHTITWASRS
jgi:hypothetical protein